MFHITIDKALLLWKRELFDIQPTVTCLCTRVKWVDEDDWKRLLILIKYIQETENDKLITDMNDMTMAYGYADTVFELNANSKNAHGICINCG